MVSIKEELLSGVFWTAIAKYSSLLVTLIVSMILARLIAPEEFGIVAIANIFIVFLTMLSQIGIGPAIVQSKDLSRNDYNNIFGVSLYIGLILALIFYLSSESIANLYSEEKLVTICHILCVNVFFSAINMVPNALMLKNKRFKDIAKITLIIQLFAAVCSVTAAFVGFGVYALIVSPVFLSVGLFVYCYNQYPLKVYIRPEFSSLKKILSFSVYQFLFEFSNYFSRNLDKLIIGKYISVHALGYYEKSYTLVQMPQQYITGIISPVLQPVLCKLEKNKEELANNYNKIISIIATLSFPIGIVLYFCAMEIIVIMFGECWIPAVRVFQIISLSLPTQMILSTSGSIWQASNSTKGLFVVGSINTIIVITGFFVAAYFFRTIEAVAWSWTMCALITFLITYTVMYKHILKSSLLAMLKTLLHPAINSLLIMLSYILYNSYAPNHNPIVGLIGKLLIAMLNTLVYLQMTKQIDIKKKIRI